MSTLHAQLNCGQRLGRGYLPKTGIQLLRSVETPAFRLLRLSPRRFCPGIRKSFACQKGRRRRQFKLNRVGAVEDIMGAVVFLASDASAMVTGASLLVDGGWTAG